ncbi:MAG: hypothetical protein KME16_11750 [Scytolyngbya sp. HA4215-MV1]|jgi:hypothetical protein|nr:hypothetical protein [Scytolyngbya sp. HA4215-MV1]
MLDKQSTEEKFSTGLSLNAVLIVLAIALSQILLQPSQKPIQPSFKQTTEVHTIQAFVPTKSGLPMRRVGGGCR